MISHRIQSIFCVCPVGLLFGVFLFIIGCAYTGSSFVTTAKRIEKEKEKDQGQVIESWWRKFDDPHLSLLVEKALSNNPGIMIACARVDQALALAARSDAGRYPVLSTSIGGGSLVNTTSGRGGPKTNPVYNASLSASYEIDLWNRIEAARAADRTEALASYQDLRTAYLSLSAEIVKTWYNLGEQAGQVAILNTQLATYKRYLEVIEIQFSRGQVRAVDLLQQGQLIEATSGEIVLADTQMRLLEHQFDLLLGNEIGWTGIDRLPVMTELAAVDQSADFDEVNPIIVNRPDLQSARLKIAAADKRVAAAIADRYPKFSLSLKVESSVDRLKDILDHWMFNLIGNLVAPLVDGGLKRAEIELQRARYAEQLNNYRQTYLKALVETMDALVRERNQRRYLDHLIAQMSLSERATEEIFGYYTKGMIDFTRYLSTLIDNQRLARTLLKARNDALQFRISLHRAVGGDIPYSWLKQDLRGNDQKSMIRGVFTRHSHLFQREFTHGKENEAGLTQPPDLLRNRENDR